MESLATFTTPPGRCGYLPDQVWQLEYDIAGRITAAEFEQRLHQGWRRFGHALFRPQCPSCQRCRPIRIPVATFQPNRSQKRTLQHNDGAVVLEIGAPSVSEEKLALYDRFHSFQHEARGWPEHGGESAENYAESFVQHPFPTQEWQYRIDGRLVGVGYVDSLPEGLSAIYFFHDPEERKRSLGVLNVLAILRAAAEWRLPFVYLGYYIEGCRSMEYKSGYRPNEILEKDGWRPFR